MLSQAFTEMSKEAWENAPSTTNAVERKNLDIKQMNPVDFKAAMIKSYKLDKSYCLQHIAASEKVRLSYTNATEENIQKQASKKAKQRLNKKLPSDILALHGPPDKTSNFAGLRKRNNANSSLSPHAKKSKVSSMPPETSTNTPDYTVMMKTCHVLYDDDKWYEGTITGCEKDENDTWKYKITFSDGEFTYACKGDPEVRFPKHHD